MKALHDAILSGFAHVSDDVVREALTTHPVNEAKLTDALYRTREHLQADADNPDVPDITLSARWSHYERAEYHHDGGRLVLACDELRRCWSL